jgi:glycogen debranching enzyme
VKLTGFIISGFSPFNSPHLAPALELDTAIIDFSSTLAAEGLPTRVTSMADLDAIMTAFTSTFESLRLWEYYVLSVEAEKAAVRSAIASSSAVIPEWAGEAVAGLSVVDLANIVRASGSLSGVSTYAHRFGVHVYPLYAASLVMAAFSERNAEALAEAWGRVVDVLNVDLYAEAEDDKKSALDGIRNRVKYTRLDDHGPKLGEISTK